MRLSCARALFAFICLSDASFAVAAFTAIEFVKAPIAGIAILSKVKATAPNIIENIILFSAKNFTAGPIALFRKLSTACEISAKVVASKAKGSFSTSAKAANFCVP